MLNTAYRLLLLFAISLVSLSAFSQKYKNIYVFGDSLSDQGNLAALSQEYTFLLDPPFNQGRFTNGAVTVEALAEKIGLRLSPSYFFTGQESGNNYAVAGAKASGNAPIDLTSQVDAFLQYNNFHIRNKTLVVLFIGGNDIRAARDASTNSEANTIMRSAARNIYQSIKKLIKAGAVDVLVANAPNIALIPETDAIAKAQKSRNAYYSAYWRTIEYNTKLSAVVKVLRKESPKVNFIEFNLFSFFNNSVRKASRRGFVNNNDACFSTSIQGFTPECKQGSLIDQFIFFDDIHPTRRVHDSAAEAILRKLR